MKGKLPKLGAVFLKLDVVQMVRSVLAIRVLPCLFDSVKKCDWCIFSFVFLLWCWSVWCTCFSSFTSVWLPPHNQAHQVKCRKIHFDSPDETEQVPPCLLVCLTAGRNVYKQKQPEMNNQPPAKHLDMSCLLACLAIQKLGALLTYLGKRKNVIQYLPPPQPTVTSNRLNFFYDIEQ